MLSVTHRAAVGVCAVILIGTTAGVSTAFHRSPVRTGPVPASDAMISVLGAASPNPSLGDEARTFDQFVGAWDADFGFPQSNGTTTHKKGELFFGWVLDGRAIQDLWIGYPSGPGKERTIGTTVRFFDTSTKQWRITFVGPQYNSLVTARGGREGDRIVFRGVDKDGIPFRWTFRDITADSFHWTGETSHDGGETWKLEEDHHMTRRHTDVSSRTRAEFNELKTLAGDWQGSFNGTPTKVSYKVTADGSAVMLTEQADSTVMITMFTVDGDHLLATHYCSVGNQPQMVSTTPGDLARGITFSLARVTGMKTPDDWHNTGLTISRDSTGPLTHHWTWLDKGKEGTTEFHFSRKGESSVAPMLNR